MIYTLSLDILNIFFVKNCFENVKILWHFHFLAFDLIYILKKIFSHFIHFEWNYVIF